MDEKEVLRTFIDSLDKWAIFCGVLVALGVVGESAVGYLHWTKGNRLHVLEEADRLTQQSAIDAARAEAAKASAQAADANARAAEANLQAAEANKIAEGERLERLKIEERLAPRALTAQQQADLINRLRAFARTKINQFVVVGAEPVRLSNQIFAALEQAKWVASVISMNDLLTSAVGIIVEAVPDASGGMPAGAVALATALRAQGLAVTGPIEPKIGPVAAGAFLGTLIDDAKIRIVIGPK